MFKTRIGKAALTMAAAGTLVLPGASAAQAAAVHRAEPTQATTSAVASLHLRSAAVTPAIPVGRHSLSTKYAPASFCLESQGYNNQAVLASCDNLTSFWNISQLTATDSRGGAWVTLQNANDGYCLDAQANATGSPNNNGDHVNSWPCDGALQQQWYLWPLSNHAWEIVNHYNTDMVLDAMTNDVWNPSESGDPVQLWYHNSEVQQQWQISI